MEFHDNDKSTYKTKYLSELKEGDKNLRVFVRIVDIKPETLDFDSGSLRKREALIADSSGKVRATFYGDVNFLPLKIGDPLKIVNPVIIEDSPGIGFYLDFEYSPDTSVIDLEESEANDLPSLSELKELIYLSELENLVYTTRHLDELRKGDKNVGVFGRILNLIPETLDSDSGSLIAREAEICDGTWKVRATFHGMFANLPLKIGDPIQIINPKILEENYYHGVWLHLDEEYSPDTYLIKLEEDEIKGLPSLKEFGDIFYKTKHVNELRGKNDRSVRFFVRILDLGPILNHEHEYLMGREAVIGDSTGKVRATFHGMFANLPLKIGDPIQIINPKIEDDDSEFVFRLYEEYSFEQYPLYPFNTSVVKLQENEIEGIPSLFEFKEQNIEFLPSSFEEGIFIKKNIGALREGDGNVILFGRIMNNFGTSLDDLGGPVVTQIFEIADVTGKIIVHVMDDNKVTFNIGDPIKIESSFIDFNYAYTGIYLVGDIILTKLKETEIENLPSLEELEDIFYTNKKIEDVGKKDEDIKVTGKIIEDYEKTFYKACPNCHHEVNLSKDYYDYYDSYICECGKEVKTIVHIRTIYTVIEDETGTMKIKFFGEAANEFIEKVGINKGLEITILADAFYDKKKKEIVLNAQKIVS